jgi:hypothetical protein
MQQLHAAAALTLAFGASSCTICTICFMLSSAYCWLQRCDSQNHHL